MKNDRIFKTALMILITSLMLLFVVPISADETPGAEDVSLEESFRQAQILSNAFRQTSRKVIPSVVKIIIQENAELKDSKKFLPFGDIFPDLPNEEEIEGVGSGVLVDPKGIILTNNHVVSEGQNINVELYDGRKFSAKTVKKDPKSDLAVLTLESKEELPYLTFADSDQLEIGDWVLAIGNPFMLESSVSAGIISAKKRFLHGQMGKREHGSFIQTDAAVNPGNSGGPLVNLKGEIVGINTAIASLSGGNQGIGFAIPSNTAVWIMKQLIEKGKVDRAFLGAPFDSLKYEEAKRYKLAPREGVKIGTPFKDSPAAKAGLKSNDVILAFDEKPIDSLETLQMLIECADVSLEHQLTVLRNNNHNRLNFPIKLEILPDNYVGIPQTEQLVKKGEHYNDRALGLMLIPLTTDSAKRLNIPEDQRGLVVLSVMPGSLAYQAGIRDGMLLTKVNQQSVSNVEEFDKIRQSVPQENELEFEVFYKGEAKIIRLKK
ncbi:MAG: trypsin-like peptidase domain-containing protein [Planctomycetia bacterium]|nr:trypsin-like peptidase domain-containing protein [Planctomycetia bacterium]